MGKFGELRRVFLVGNKGFAYVGYRDASNAEKAVNQDLSQLGSDVRAELDVKKDQGGGGGRGGGFGGGRGGGGG